MLIIGIDPGVKTGLAVWDAEKGALTHVRTESIVSAMAFCRWRIQTDRVEIWFEDARKRTWFGGKGREALQGAGSIKRDCSIWEEFCTFHDIPFQAIAPKKGGTKWSAGLFKRVTGWPERTSEHARDAAMLVYKVPGRR